MGLQIGRNVILVMLRAYFGREAGWDKEKLFYWENLSQNLQIESRSLKAAGYFFFNSTAGDLSRAGV